MTLRPRDALFGLCLPYRKGVRPAVEVYFCAFGAMLFPHRGDRYEPRVDRAFIFEAIT